VRPDARQLAAADTDVMSQIEPRACSLRLTAVGEFEQCPRQRCVFWEDGGAVMPGSCAIERLGIDIGTPDLAAYLLELRERIEQARDRAEAEAAHREFSRRLGRDV
jgi:hypothetical protein